MKMDAFLFQSAGAGLMGASCTSRTPAGGEEGKGTQGKDLCSWKLMLLQPKLHWHTHNNCDYF